MQSTSTLPTVERLIPIGIVYSCVYAGVADRAHKDHAEVLSMLRAAMNDEMDGLPATKRASADRYSRKASDAILKPFVDRHESCAKASLVFFYAIRQLIDEGLYELRDGPFSEAMDAVLNPDGTVTEMANIDGVDKSAQKQARKVVQHMRELGYYRGE